MNLMIEFMKNKRRISYHRRDSRLGMLIGKSSHLKPSEPHFQERRYNSQLTADNRLFSKASIGDQSSENAELPIRNPVINQDDSIISGESTFIKQTEIAKDLYTVPIHSKDENLNKYINELSNEINSSDHTNNYKELAHELSSILVSMNRCTELLNTIGSEGESIDPTLVDLLSNINMKANTLQNAGFYTMLKRSLFQSHK